MSNIEEKDDEDLEWEEWKPNRISFVYHMMAGSMAGLAEHVSIFPIDTLKTHIQCERCGAVSPFQTWNCATKIIKREGNVCRLCTCSCSIF
jgi:solute carrier family 25 iron transporter 28/37